MKNITEKFNDRLSISQMISQSDMIANLDESLKDVFNLVKSKFKQVWEWVKGLVVKIGVYYVPVDEDGFLIPAITPMTAGAAYREGYAKDDFTFVYNGKEESKISGLKNNINDVFKIYGSDNKNEIFKYWSNISESSDPNKANVNEVRLHTEDPEAKYNIICDDEELRDLISRHVKKANLARLLIWGAPGIGKTFIIKDVVDGIRKSGDPNYNLIVKTLSNETPDNFMLPKYVEVGEGNVKAEDVPKTWLPVYHPTGDAAKDSAADAALGRGMLFVDELSRATPQVLNVILPLVNEGEFNGWKMGSGWCIVCASNRMQDEESGQTSLGNALKTRFAQVYFEPTVHSWRKWAEKQNYISPLLIQWLSLPETENMSGGKYYYMDPNEEIENAEETSILCNPRQWDNAMRELATYSHTGDLLGFTIFDIPTNIIARTINQYIPVSAVDSFIAFLHVIHSIGDFDRVTADIWKNGGKSVKISAKDLMKIALPLAQLIITSHADKLPTEDEFVNLCTWIKDQNNDQLASYILDIFKSTFMADVHAGADSSNRDKLFVLHDIKKHIETLDKDQAESAKSLYDSIWKAFFNRWGVDWDSMPDYSKGLKIAGEAFGETFRNAKVGNRSALG